jgi:hypothetical protein
MFKCSSGRLHRSAPVVYSFTTEQPTVTVNASDVDNGTSDNCGAVTLEIVELAVQNLTAQVHAASGPAARIVGNMGCNFSDRSFSIQTIVFQKKGYMMPETIQSAFSTARAMWQTSTPNDCNSQTREVLGTSVTCGDVIEARMAGLAFVATFQAVDASNNMATKVCANLSLYWICG